MLIPVKHVAACHNFYPRSAAAMWAGFAHTRRNLEIDCWPPE
ncbi:hypothetical protein HNR48_001705 [Pseudoteredinibacter isoporae]|uniref:Uncharacterized protein n=1 Tax=Pseudoteredinibacter isoporae TaxID=570281 RepID=A0A7X0JSE0_9GAMM|nr:hypothetical protein [Pseudoteredinibacter isoporae]